MRWQAGVTVPAVRMHEAARGDGLDDEGLQAARLAFETLSLADPMEPPRSVVTGRDNDQTLRLTALACEEDSLPARLSGRTYFIQEAPVQSWIQTRCRRGRRPERSL